MSYQERRRELQALRKKRAELLDKLDELLGARVRTGRAAWGPGCGGAGAGNTPLPFHANLHVHVPAESASEARRRAGATSQGIAGITSSSPLGTGAAAER